MRILGRWFSQLCVLSLGMVSSVAFADYKMNLSPGVTPVSHTIYDLHTMAFWVCVAIGVVVFGVMGYSLIMHRKSRGAKAASFHEHPVLELVWAIIPFFILIAIAIPATKALIAMDDHDDADVNIKITGYQWKWQYEYLDEGIKYFSNLATPAIQIHNEAKKDPHYLLEVDEPLILPVGKKIRFLVTANDVIHSWWVPALGVKRDAVPGFIHEAWARIEKPGIYRGQCAELCGVNHGFMPIVVEAKTQEDYDAWLNSKNTGKAAAKAAANKTWTKADLMTRGEDKYLTNCAACHKPGGEGMPPTFPALKGDNIATGPVDKHISTVLHGVPGTAMQAFGGQLDDVDLAAIITYERNAWGNNMGDMVQPVDVKKAR